MIKRFVLWLLSLLPLETLEVAYDVKRRKKVSAVLAEARRKIFAPYAIYGQRQLEQILGRKLTPKDYVAQKR